VFQADLAQLPGLLFSLASRGKDKEHAKITHMQYRDHGTPESLLVIDDICEFEMGTGG